MLANLAARVQGSLSATVNRSAWGGRCLVSRSGTYVFSLRTCLRESTQDASLESWDSPWRIHPSASFVAYAIDLLLLDSSARTQTCQGVDYGSHKDGARLATGPREAATSSEGKASEWSLASTKALRSLPISESCSRYRPLSGRDLDQEAAMPLTSRYDRTWITSAFIETFLLLYRSSVLPSSGRHLSRVH